MFAASCPRVNNTRVTTTVLYTELQNRSLANKAVHNAFCFPALFFVHSIYYLHPSFSLSLPVVTQIRGQITGSSPSLSTTVRALHFYRDKISALSSLVDSRRIVLTHARRSAVDPFFIFANKFEISPWRDSNSRTNTSSIRGLPLDHLLYG